MSFVEIGKVTDVPKGGMKPYDIEGKEILVVNVNGEFYAIARRCTHMGGDLSKGKLEESVVTCPRHGSKFNVTTGECISGPKIWLLQLSTKNVATFKAKKEDDNILVDPAEPVG